MDKVDVQPYGYVGGPRFGPRGVHVERRTEGSLTLDIVDTRTKQLVWRGTAESSIDRDASPQERRERLQEAVSKILEKFPPAPDDRRGRSAPGYSTAADSEMGTPATSSAARSPDLTAPSM